MTRTPKLLTLAAALMLITSTAAIAQSAAGRGATGGSNGTNSAGTANSSGGTIGSGLTTGASDRRITDTKPATGNPQVDAQDRAVDRKVNSICKGC